MVTLGTVIGTDRQSKREKTRVEVARNQSEEKSNKVKDDKDQWELKQKVEVEGEVAKKLMFSGHRENISHVVALNFRVIQP